MSLGKTLSSLRKNAKMTQSELGEKLNISAQAISKWENDTSEPDISTLKKLANIYGVTISDILDPNSEKTSSGDGSNAQAKANQNQLFDVYLTSALPNKIAVIKNLRDMLNLDLGEAFDIVEHKLPYLISAKVDAETSKKITDYFSRSGGKVISEPSSSFYPRREIKLDRPDTKTASNKHDYALKRRFITANLTAAIPAVLLMIISFILSSGFLDVMLSIYLGICTYTFIFLLWYPTVTRALLLPNRAVMESAILSEPTLFGLIGGLFDLLFFILLLPWLVIVALISPYNYAFAITKRIQRMKDGDDRDLVI